MSDERRELSEVEESTPNASGPDRSAGGMGVSSERRGDDVGGAGSVEGTGSMGTSTTETTGTDQSAGNDET